MKQRDQFHAKGRKIGRLTAAWILFISFSEPERIEIC